MVKCSLSMGISVVEFVCRRECGGTLIPIVSSNGKTTTTILIPRTENVPDEWYIKIQSVETDEDGKREKATYRVPEE